MSLEEKVQALAEIASGLLAVALAVAPVNYRDQLHYMQQTLTEILEES